MEDFVLTAVLVVFPLLLAVICHEVAHGWTAEKLGDPTARSLGRITLNPLVHIDPVGTVILPLILIVSGSPFLFGWAKPVPVNFGNLRGGRKGMALVAASVPMTNLFLAVVSAALFHWTTAGLPWLPFAESLHGWMGKTVRQMALISVKFNLVLMVINLLPVPPLDGGRIMVGLLPRSLAFQLDRLERFGMLIILILIASGLWSHLVRPVLDVFLRFLL